MDAELKKLVWKLDREVWAHVPDGGQTDPWTTSKAREESTKLIAKFLEKKVEQTQRLLRETAMRANLAFPASDEDNKWFDDGLHHKRSGDFMFRLFDALDPQESKLLENNKK